MKRIQTIITIAALASGLLFSAMAIARPVIIPAPPQLAAEAYILLDATTGEVLIEHNADEMLPPASLTKMMTSYIVSEEISTGELKETDEVLISEDAWKRGGTNSGGSTMFLKPKSRVNVLDLLKGVIIQSGNDASIALAQHLAGSEEAFADVMNQYSQLLGMHSTHFVNATGWPAEGHMSSARDLAILAGALINNHPEHYALYSQKNFTYNGIPQPNRNLLLYRDPSVDGLKTGYTRAAGYCLVSSAKKQGMRLITVVLGTKSKEARAVETQKLLAYGFRYFQTHPLYKAGEELSDSPVWKGVREKISLGITKNVVITIPKGSASSLKAEVSVDTKIEAPISKGQTLGELIVTLRGEEVYKGPLVALYDIEQSGFFARTKDSIIMFVMDMFE